MRSFNLLTMETAFLRVPPQNNHGLSLPFCLGHTVFITSVLCLCLANKSFIYLFIHSFI